MPVQQRGTQNSRPMKVILSDHEMIDRTGSGGKKNCNNIWAAVNTVSRVVLSEIDESLNRSNAQWR